MRGRRGSAAAPLAAVLVVALLGCTPADREEAGAPSRTPAGPAPTAEQPTAGTTAEQPTAGPPAITAGEVDPCLLTEQEVAEVVGVELPKSGASGGELFALCTYGGEDAGTAAPGTVDIALVDLVRVSEESGQDVDGDAYIDELTTGVGTGTATPLTGFGDGRAVRLTYAFGSQAWAWVDDQVYGAYVSDLEDADARAEALLRAVLDAQGSR